MRKLMPFTDFEKLYQQNFNRLQAAADKLKDLVNDILRSYEQEELFRPRLVEVRVKEVRSLYDRICDRSDLSHEQAFEKGKVKDLIGARIVCHNLCDILPIYSKLETHQKLKLVNGAEKNLDEQVIRGDEFGYRGLHRRVIWKHGNKEFEGEIQIRTILQDAWASFMHDDVYKSPLRQKLPKQLVQMTKHSSDLLLCIDRTAQELREYVQQKMTVEISIGESFELGFYGMLGFLTSYPRSQSYYESIKRSDTYKVKGADGVYQIDFCGVLPSDRREYFEFKLAGDTNAGANAYIRDVIDTTTNRSLLRSSALTILKGRADGADNDNVLLIRHTVKRRTHSYKIVCEWKGTFSQKDEYLHAPWKNFYGKPGSYRIRVQADRKFRQVPKMYTFAEALNVVRHLGSPEELGVPGEESAGGYEWQSNSFNEDVLFLLPFER